MGVGGDAEGDTYFSIENLIGSDYADALVGNDGNNLLVGRFGDDLLDGRDGDDILSAGAGNDTLKGGGGADWLGGHEGIDTASYYKSPEGVIVLLGLGGAGGDAEGDTFEDIENLTGSIYADILWGDDGVNKLMGMDGADVLRRPRRQRHARWRRRRRYDAGRHRRRHLLRRQWGRRSHRGRRPGPDQVQTSVSYSLAPGSEVEMLGTTDRAATTAISLGGNEYANTISGNAGVNIIVGGAGLDTMWGGDGGDIFVWHSITEMGSTLDANSDTVGDFNAAIGDLMVLNLIDADGNAGNGDTAFSFIGYANNPFTAAGQVSWLTGGADTYILLNTDGDAAADGVIRVLGVHAVDASWFVL